MDSASVSRNYIKKLLATAFSKKKKNPIKFHDDLALNNFCQLIEIEATRSFNFPGPSTLAQHTIQIPRKYKKKKKKTLLTKLRESPVAEKIYNEADNLLVEKEDHIEDKEKRLNGNYDTDIDDPPEIDETKVALELLPPPADLTTLKKSKAGRKPAPKANNGKTGRYLIELSGYRLNSKIYNEEGTPFLYKINRKSNDRAYMSCISNNCSGRIIANMIPTENDDIQYFILEGRKSRPKPHNHMPSEVEYNTVLFVGRCKNRAMNTSEDIRAIFESELSRFEENVPNTTYNSIEAALHKIRTNSHPPIPISVDDMIQRLPDTRYRLAKEGGDFYHTYFTLADGSQSVIFLSPQLKNQVNAPDIHELYLDASYNVVPGPPKFCHLFTIHFVFCDFSFPVLYALMTMDSDMAYTSILAHFRRLCPGLHPRKIITDYSESMMRAAWQVFGDIPNVHIVGSMFHFSQVLFRKLHEIGLMDIYRNGNIHEKTILHSCFALPLLNPQEMYWGITSIQEETKQLHEGPIKENIIMFLQYLLNYWMSVVTPPIFSVNGDSLRTSNVIELFLIQLRNTIVISNVNNIWLFIGKLIEYDDRESKHYQIVENSLRTSRKIRTKQLLKNSVIKDLRQKLSDSLIDVSHFLSNVAFHIFEKLERNKPVMDYVQTDYKKYIKIDVSDN